MPRVFEGELSAQGLRLGIVVARFNETITQRLLEGAQDALRRHGASDVDIAWVPGSFDIPLVARRLAETGYYQAIICLGAVIRGETPHFEYVSNVVSQGVARVALESGVPTIFGVITADTVEQAMDRAGVKGGNKGYDAALAAIEMANLMRQIVAE
ncbi:MAG TPA: 6,7-dimethyl-8-ribityllumazine synthase [Dehalococcoidia bacterium]|nr:6,7-dimethyl-8-ribityllumazine synthase [Dehalococcoidia bacterium]